MTLDNTTTADCEPSEDDTASTATASGSGNGNGTEQDTTENTGDCNCLGDRTGWRLWAATAGITLYLALWSLFGFHLVTTTWPADQPDAAPGPDVTATMEADATATPDTEVSPTTSVTPDDPDSSASQTSAGSFTIATAGEDSTETESDKEDPSESDGKLRLGLLPELGSLDLAVRIDPPTVLRELLLAAGAGIIGAAGWGLISFAMQGLVLHHGQVVSGFAVRTCSYYLVRPVAGPALGALLFGIARMGAVGIAGGDIDTASPIAIFGIGALAGLFMVDSVQVLEKAMKTVFRLEAASPSPGNGGGTAGNGGVSPPPADDENRGGTP